MVAAADKAGVVLMVAYMKRHDPAYRYAQARVREMADVRFVQVNHLHPDNSLHLAEFRVHRFDDVPADRAGGGGRRAPARDRRGAGLRRSGRGAAGIARAYSTILGSMIHDIGNLHGLFGPPARVVSERDLGRGARASAPCSSTPARSGPSAPGSTCRSCGTSEETLEVYGSRERVLASFPTGFARGLPSTVTVHGMDADRTPWRKELSWHDNPSCWSCATSGDCVLEGADGGDRRPRRHPRHRARPRHRAGLPEEVGRVGGSGRGDRRLRLPHRRPQRGHHPARSARASCGWSPATPRPGTATTSGTRCS